MLKYQLLLALPAFVLFGCKGEEKRSVPAENETSTQTERSDKENDNYVPKSSGKEFEVLVVGENIRQNNNIIEAVDSIFFTYFPGLALAEHWFSPAYVNADNFEGLFYRHKSIVFLSHTPNSPVKTLVEEKFSQTELNDDRLNIRYNVWARPQIVVYLEASSEKELIEKLHSRTNALLVNLDYNEEREIKDKLYEGPEEMALGKEMKEKLGYSLRIPSLYEKVMVEKKPDVPGISVGGFAWFRLDSKSAGSHVLAYDIPYDKNYFNVDSILRVRNRIGKRYIDGPAEGSYQQVEFRYPVESYNRTIDETGGMVIKGSWRIEGDQMGGPFVLYAVPDKKNNRIIILDGFVYAAGSKKKPFIKRLETILTTFKAH